MFFLWGSENLENFSSSLLGSFFTFRVFLVVRPEKVEARNFLIELLSIVLIVQRAGLFHSSASIAADLGQIQRKFYS